MCYAYVLTFCMYCTIPFAVPWACIIISKSLETKQRIARQPYLEQNIHHSTEKRVIYQTSSWYFPVVFIILIIFVASSSETLLPSEMI